MKEQLYDDIYRAELTHWWFRARRQIVAAMLRRFAPKKRPLQIIDVGCGMGASFTMLAEFGKVIGADFSSAALAYSRTRTSLPLVAAALPSLPFPDDSFDVVTAMDVIEHIEDDLSAVREMWRVCRPGGILLVTVPALQWM